MRYVWFGSAHITNKYIPQNWHIRFTARKWYDGSKEKKTVPNLTLQEFMKAIETNIAWKYLGHSGSYHNGAFLAGVSTGGLGDGWSQVGGPFNHYIAIDGYVPNYNDGSGHGTHPGLVFMDTAYSSSVSTIFGDNPTKGHAAYVAKFLLNAIEQNQHMPSGGYISDRMIVFAQRTK